MSIIRCEHCGKQIDTDEDVDHEKECGSFATIENIAHKEQKMREEN